MKFSDIPGHESIKQRLVNMVDSGRLPHALLLYGRPGIGKMMLARALAQYIHCTDKQNGDSCGRCPACLQHRSFNQADTYFSFPVLKNGKDTAVSDDYIAEWREFLTESPYMDLSRWLVKLDNVNGQPKMYVEEADDLTRKLNITSRGKRQIVIMWLPERLGAEVANKMLKLIEEPPTDVLFIFVSNDTEAILPTIYSRLQRVEVLKQSDCIVEDYLTRNFGNKFSASTLHALAHLADGSMIEAERAVSDTETQRQYLLLFQQLMRLAYQKKVAELRGWSNDVAAMGREGIVSFLSYCERQLRENFISHLQLQELNYMTTDEAQFSKNFHRFINERNIEEFIERFDTTVNDILANGNAKILLFDLAVHVIMLIRK